MVDLHIIIEITYNHEQYNFFNNYWKVEFPNAHFKRHTFYSLNEHFKPVIDQFSEEIESKYFTAYQIKRLVERFESYQKHKKTWLIQTERFGYKIIGRCKPCGKSISELLRKGKDYHIYGGNIVCDNCFQTGNNKKWM